MDYRAISGAVPAQLGNSVTFNVGLPYVPKRGSGMLFYMVDTRKGNHVYRILVNGSEQCKIALPDGNNFATLHTEVGHLGTINVISFESDTPDAAPVDILNVTLFYEA
ncbi:MULTISPECIES: hypothetical protein [Parafrankia]|uniref:Uncharacterized protein n=1 Tax=Parafrankia colletiae TaxID=573497 RepID=A0A1S1RFK5_9ACTN|nr:MULTISPECIES: hypothetical protein [Parafrankia]MCK9903186.1 hypothetical protein [Frankia sp. Cpl3]OHV44980.1 hypothetical protein CC117_09795 [Parafrankia colletiae]